MRAGSNHGVNARGEASRDSRPPSLKIVWGRKGKHPVSPPVRVPHTLALSPTVRAFFLRGFAPQTPTAHFLSQQQHLPGHPTSSLSLIGLLLHVVEESLDQQCPASRFCPQLCPDPTGHLGKGASSLSLGWGRGTPTPLKLWGVGDCC